MAAIKALFSDIDGTAIRSDHTMSSAVARSFRDCMDRGCTVVLASSRSSQGMMPLVRSNGLEGVWISAYGGGLLVDGCGRTLAEHGFSRTLALSIVQFVEERFGDAAAAGVYTARHWYVKSRKDPRIAREERIVQTTSQEGGPEALEENETVGKILFICRPEATLSVRDALRQRFGALHVSTSSDILVEVNAAGISKATAVDDVCSQLGIDPASTAAIGDAANDLPMLDAAGIAIAMGNAVPAVKEKADFVCGTNDEDGVAEACTRLWKSELISRKQDLI